MRKFLEINPTLVPVQGEPPSGNHVNWDHESLIAYKSQGKVFNLAVPTPEHFLPLLYILALQEKNETVSLFNDKAVAGSLTMTSVKIELITKQMKDK